MELWQFEWKPKKIIWHLVTGSKCDLFESVWTEVTLKKMSKEPPKRKISAALQQPNFGEHHGGLATISESGPLRKVSQNGPERKISMEHGPERKISTELGGRRVSGEHREGRKVSNFSVIGRKTSFMAVPEKVMISKVSYSYKNTFLLFMWNQNYIILHVVWNLLRQVECKVGRFLPKWKRPLKWLWLRVCQPPAL